MGVNTFVQFCNIKCVLIDVPAVEQPYHHGGVTEVCKWDWGWPQSPPPPTLFFFFLKRHKHICSHMTHIYIINPPSMPGYQCCAHSGRPSPKQGGAGQHGRFQRPVGEASAHSDRGCGWHHLCGWLPFSVRYSIAQTLCRSAKGNW